MAINRSANIDEASLRGLHPDTLSESTPILRLLEQAMEVGSELTRGLNHRLDRETARIICLTQKTLILETSGFRRNNRNQVFLNFELDGRPYFFASRPTGPYRRSRLEIEIPKEIFSTERRDRIRRSPRRSDRNINILIDGGKKIPAQIEDVSPGGLGICVPADAWHENWRTLRIAYADGSKSENPGYASVRNSRDSARSGWKRLGLVESPSPTGDPISIDRLQRIVQGLSDLERPPGNAGAFRNQAHHAKFVEFEDRDGRRVAGFLDQNDYPGDLTSVVLQTGWGETKESLLPLARTIIDTFSKYGQPIAVLRIDGVNQRGESHKEPDCQIRGREYNRFGFSQSVRDLEAATVFLRSTLSPKKTILVSQSIAALAGRKFVALDKGTNIDGWICVVGASDLQSASRAISGGVDFAVGHDHGITFGYQELLGVMIHADRMMADAIDVGVLHIADARKDFADIQTPVCWFHGEFDAWVNLKRVADIMSFGSTQNRKLVTLPIAHRLGWSTSALETFGAVANEVSRMALDRSFEPERPNSDDMARRRAWERERRPKLETDLRKFWKDYLLGRDGSIGFELMTACDPYEALMSDQIDRLQLASGDRVLDLGCGTGALAHTILHAGDGPDHVSVVGIDHVPEALVRARLRAESPSPQRKATTVWVAADLDIVEGRMNVPLVGASFDSVLASLFLSYVERPFAVLEEAYRLLRPGGRLVVSSLLRDADISRLYTESLAELRATDILEFFPEMGDLSLENVARNFLNDAAKILELEANGSFVFWEPADLSNLLQRAGFSDISHSIAFGYPGQAVVVSATKPL